PDEARRGNRAARRPGSREAHRDWPAAVRSTNRVWSATSHARIRPAHRSTYRDHRDRSTRENASGSEEAPLTPVRPCDRRCRRLRSIRLRLHRGFGMLERHKMQMLGPATIDNVAFHLYPGVRLE